MRGTSITLSITVIHKPIIENHMPQMVRSVSLYHSDKLKKMPKNNSAIITTGTTFNPLK